MKSKFTAKESTALKGVWEFSSSISNDKRGYIWTSFDKNLKKILPNEISFKHDKFSLSKQNVLRGIHGDNKSWKLVSCVYGEIMQVVVDLRKDSKTYLKWQSFDLKGSRNNLVLIPPNMGNAFYVRSSEALYHYKLAYEGDYFDANQQFSIQWNDKKININWPSNSPILSSRDEFK